MKLFYASSISYPSQYANRIQTLSTAQALSKELGDNFILGASEVKSNNLYTGRLINFHTARSFFLAWLQLRFCKKQDVDTIFCREYGLLFSLILYNKFFFHKKIVFLYEEHELRDNWRFTYITGFINHIFCLTQNLKRDLFTLHPQLKSSVLPDAVQLEDFNQREVRRSNFSLPKTRIISYIGSVGVHEWKGVDVLLDSLAFLKDIELCMVVAGVTPSDEKKLKHHWQDKRIRTFPWLDRTQVVELMQLSDVLVLPNKSGNPNSERFTSPLKLFEYMASGTPIVASNLPSIREVLNEKNALLFHPNDPKSLADNIKMLLADTQLGQKLSSQSLKDVQSYTWTNRARKILKIAESLGTSAGSIL